MTRARERGSAMLITLVVITGLLAGAAVLVGLQLRSTRSSDVVSNGTAALYCAEAGLAAARPVVAASYGLWNGSMCTAEPCTTEPTWLATIDHELDSPAVTTDPPDFRVVLKDNDDELAPVTLDPTRDNDQKVFVVVTCLKYPGVTKQVSELLELTGGGNCNYKMLGGPGGDGNANNCP